MHKRLISLLNANNDKQFMLGSHIPILSPEAIRKAEPDYVVILPWYIADEVQAQLSPDLPNTQFLIAVPELEMS